MKCYFQNLWIPVISLTTLLIGGCGDGGSDNNSLPTSTAPSASTQPVSEGDTEEDNEGDNDEGASGGASVNTYTAVLGMLQSTTTRQNIMEDLAKGIYADDGLRITLNYDFKQTGEQSYVPGKMHSGLDFQSYANTPLRSLVNGIVVITDYEHGSVTVEFTNTLNGEVYWISYLHMENIQKSVGDTVSVNDVLGSEGAQKTESRHAHIEVSRPCLLSDSSLGLLSINPDSTTWQNAVDPMEISQSLLNGYSEAAESRIHFINFYFKGQKFVPAQQNEFTGCAYIPKTQNVQQSFSKVVTFDVLDDMDTPQHTETFDVTVGNNYLANGRLIALDNYYHFGTEPVFYQPISLQHLRVTVSDVSNSTQVSRLLDVSSSVAPQSDAIIDLNFDWRVNYFDNPVKLSGTVSDSEGVASIVFKMSDKRASDKEYLHEFNFNFDKKDCGENCVSIVDYDINNSKLITGEYDVSVIVTDQNGNETEKSLGDIVIQNPVVDFTFPSTITIGKEVLFEVFGEQSLTRIINLPLQMKVEIDGQEFSLGNKYETTELSNGFDYLSLKRVLSENDGFKPGTFQYKIVYSLSSFTEEQILYQGTMTLVE
jgi:hypothetical protein